MLLTANERFKKYLILSKGVAMIEEDLRMIAKNSVIDELFNLFSINFSWCDKNGHILGCNKSTFDFFYYHVGLEDVIGKHVRDIASPEAWENTKKVLKTGIPMADEEIHIDEDGMKTYFVSMKSPLKNDKNEIIGMVNIALDITDRKLLEMEWKKAKEEAELNNKNKTEFLSNMRHDLRTPFSGILGMSQLLESQEEDPIKKESLGDIVASSKSLLNHLNEIMEFVEVENGKIPLVEKEFNIHEVIKDVFLMLLPAAKDKELDFELWVDKELPEYLLGDSIRIQRILMNLITNAVKFTEKGFVNVKAYWNKTTDERGILQIVVEDNGIGIPSDKREFIFEKFSRLTSAYHGIYPGKGLGLNIMKQFLEELNGQFELVSEVGKGTTFTVLIPHKISLFKTIKQRHFKTDSDKVLLIEDYPIVSKMSKKIMENTKCSNFEVDIAETGLQALEMMEKQQYDLVLMDIGLPDIDGYELTRRVRAHKDPYIATVPIIALTAHTGIEQKCIDVGIDDILTKPLTEEIIKSIQDYLSLRRSHHASTITKVK